MAEKQSKTILREARELSAAALRADQNGDNVTAQDLQRQANDARATARALQARGE